MSKQWTWLATIATHLRWASLSRTQRAAVAYAAQHQEDVIRVLTVLPGRYTYDQVNAAINTAGVHPIDIYESLAANRSTMALARFYEALNGPRKEFV